MDTLIIEIKKQYSELSPDPGYYNALWVCGCCIYRDEPVYCEKHHSKKILSPLNEKRLTHFGPIIEKQMSDAPRKTLLRELSKHTWYPDSCSHN